MLITKGIVFVAIKEPEVSFAYPPNDNVEDDGKFYFQDEVFDNIEDAYSYLLNLLRKMLLRLLKLENNIKSLRTILRQRKRA